MERKCLTDHKKSIVLFLLVFITYSLIYVTKNCYSAAMAAIIDAGIMTKSETGLIASAFYIVYAPFQIVGGVAADKYSPAKLILIGVAGAGVCNLLIYFVEGYVAMIIIWSLNAMFQFGIWPSIFKIVATQLSPDHRMRGVFLIYFATSLGLLLSYVIAIIVSEWKLNFLISSIILFVTGIVFFLVYFSLKKDMVPDTERGVEKTSFEAKYSGKELFLIIVKAGIPLAIFAGMIQSMLNLGVKSLAPTMLMESYEAVTPAIGNALNIILVLAGPGGLFVSRMKLFKRISEPCAVSVCFAAMLVPLSIIIFVGKAPLALIVAALTLLMTVASASSIFFPFMYKKFDKFDCVATLTGISNCMASFGIVLANYVFARIADSYSWEITAIGWFALVAFSFVVSVVLIPIWKRFEKKYLQS